MESTTTTPGSATEENDRHLSAVEDHVANGGAPEDFEPGPPAPTEALEGENDSEEEPEVLKLEIEGEGQLTLTVGGKKPEASTIKLVGGKMDIAEGDFDKGSRINLLLGCVVTEVSFVDTYDQYGNISGTERRHKVRPLRVERVRD